MWNTILINKTYCEPSNNDADEVLSGRKRNPYSECMLILIRINYCPFHNEIGIKESTQHQVDCGPHDRSCLQGPLSHQCPLLTGWIFSTSGGQNSFSKRDIVVWLIHSLCICQHGFSICMQPLGWWKEETSCVSSSLPSY